MISYEAEDSTCTVTRFGWDLAVLSEVSVLCIQGLSVGLHLGVDLSPDGTQVATVTLLLGEEFEDPGIFTKLAVTSLFDAVSGEELMRVHGALPSRAGFQVHDGRSRWLADSSGLVLETRTGTDILGMDGDWVSRSIASEPGLQGLVIPARDDSGRLDRPRELLYGYCPGDRNYDPACRVMSATVVDREGRELASMEVLLRKDPGVDLRVGDILALPYNRTSWGLTSREIRVHLSPGGPYQSSGYSPLREPRVELPPFSDADTLRVATGASCGHVRESRSVEAASLACLPAKTVVESVKPPLHPKGGHPDGYRSSRVTWSHGYWIHLRTSDGIEGWMHSDDLVGWQPTATPSPPPSPTATPATLPAREDLGIREVDTAQALAAAGLTHVRYAAGEQVPWEAGLFLLDVATGEVEGWVVSEGDAVDEEGTAIGTVAVPFSLSPGKRFLLLPGGALHDRMTSRTYAGAPVVVQPSYPFELVGWGSGSGERLVLWSDTAQAHVVVDSEMQTLAQLEGAGPDLWPHADGRYLFAHDGDQLQLFNLRHSGADTIPPSATWPVDLMLPSKDFEPNRVPFDGGLAEIDAIDTSTCRIRRYSADGQPPTDRAGGQPPTDHEYPCWQYFGPFIDIAPDGRLIALARSGVSSADAWPQVTGISVFDATTGEELLRVRNAGQARGASLD
ncbi:MAG: hypothetical protein OXH89_06125, partial [bacterium]|nr:hypothetical protein [bacterium]